MMTDNELLSRLANLSKIQTEAECDIIAHLIEVNRRSLHLKKAYRSLFDFTFQFLKCSEATASRRVAVARVAERFPATLRMLRSQQVTLTSLAMIAPHLTPDNCESLLQKITGASKRETEKLIASFSPTRAKRDIVRPIAEPVPESPRTGETLPENSGTMNLSGEPLVLGPTERKESKTERVRIAFDAPAALAEKIERLKEIHAHKLKDGSLAEILEMAIDTLLDKTAPERKVEPKKKKQIKTLPIPSQKQARRPAISLQREVWKRDKGQCIFADGHGKRCSAKSHLQVDHVQPWALGGSSRDLGNLRLLCRAHNLLEARKYFPAWERKVFKVGSSHQNV